MMMDLPRLSVGRVFTVWSLHPWTAAAAAVLLLAYLAGARRARQRGGWSLRRTAPWLLGVVVLVTATQGSVADYGDSLFIVHMVQHLLLIMVVPVLLVLGRPLDLVLAATGPAAAARLRAAFTGRVAAVVTNPAVTLVLYSAVIAGTHLTGFMDTMMLHPWLRDGEVALYVASGFLFFLPLLGESPIRWQLVWPLRMAVLVLAMPVDTFTGVVLGQTERYPWPVMASTRPAWGPSLLTDLHGGGAVMWIGGDAIMIVLLAFAAVAWVRAAAVGDGSELGGWLGSVRTNYQSDLTGTAGASTVVGAAAPTGDSDAELAAYNDYLSRLHSHR